MTKNNSAIVRERREQIHSLVTKGMKGYEIAKELNVDPSTISRDIQYLTRQYSDSLSILAKETMPFMYQTALDGIRDVLKECWSIYNNKGKDESLTWMHRISSLKLAKECSESLFKLVTEGPSLMYLNILETRMQKLEGYNIQED